jgi:hypothetical protein
MKIQHIVFAAFALTCSAVSQASETPDGEYIPSPMRESSANPLREYIPAPMRSFVDKGEELLNYALSLTGTNYRIGGISPETGFDCSGFVRHVFNRAAGMTLPHNALAISLAGEKISPAELRPGDLVFFNTLRKTFSHVGIYIGNNQFVHATSSKTGTVMVSSMSDSYWSRNFNGARRLEITDAPAAIAASIAAAFAPSSSAQKTR